ncbi:unnamed protein product, partial [Medioppia subpectinata]
MFYNRTSQESYAIDARERAPITAHKNMFRNNANLSEAGPLAIATPGIVAGYWELHQRSGLIEWRRLFDGAIKYAKDGFKVGKNMANCIKLTEHQIRSQPSF